jgi:inner membrane protein involved in colicin E2 resistance
VIKLFYDDEAKSLVKGAVLLMIVLAAKIYAKKKATIFCDSVFFCVIVLPRVFA